ncbi:hypothetical protein JNB88_31275 [Rhizobium cauense]|uniref:hypothetical protein n=1 Tax=Rhizobium cauense TaxID=1166683 RepID=UPI001C6DE79A|nr:hypothetical protein [Rhizobium cauense]MBW9118097.1 hypothetical protein [Rhizobium cauense]
MLSIEVSARLELWLVFKVGEVLNSYERSFRCKIRKSATKPSRADKKANREAKAANKAVVKVASRVAAAKAVSRVVAAKAVSRAVAARAVNRAVVRANAINVDKLSEEAGPPASLDL